MRSLTVHAVTALLAATTVFGCSAADASDAAGSPGAAAAGGGDPIGSGGGAGSGGSSGTGVPPPEREIESSFRSPVTTGRFVWAANPVSGRVAIIDAVSYQVQTVQAGFGPTHLAAVHDEPNRHRAIVINVKGNDATLLEASDLGQVSTRQIKLHDGANAWAISSTGRFAIAWTNADTITNPDPTEGFQDITVIDLSQAPPAATRLSVGYRPTQVVIAADESRAFVVNEPGISVVDLGAAGPIIQMDLAVTSDPLDEPASRDVSILPDGSFALVRRDGSPKINVVSLASGALVEVTLSGPVTDLDLSADARSALAVVRDQSEVVLLPIPGVFSAPTSFASVKIAGEIFGSVVVSAEGARALLYSNAVPNDHLTILNTAAGTDYLTHRTVALKSPIEAVFVADDAQHAIALLEPAVGSSKAGAFSLIPLAQALPPKIQGTDAPPIAVSFAPPPSSRAVVTTRDDAFGRYAAYLASFPELGVDQINLASPPLAVGMVPGAAKAYVAQQHPEGRITFITLMSGTARTLTGFELASRVIDGN